MAEAELKQPELRKVEAHNQAGATEAQTAWVGEEDEVDDGEIAASTDAALLLSSGDVS